MMKKFLGKSKAAMMMLSMAVMAMALPSVSGAAPLDFTDTDVGISTTDVIQTGINFIQGVVPDFVLLGLGIIFAVVIVGFLFWIVQKIRRAAPGK